MKIRPRILAVIPARGGSRGLPGKNIRPLAGLPLIAHSIRFARMCPEITRCVVSTDSAKIARVARRFGADVPFLRPAALARGNTPMWPVLRHALAEAERAESRPYDFLILLDPTSPTRLPSDLKRAMRQLALHPSADGVVAVSEPDFNPVWHCVVEKRGWMEDFAPSAARIHGREKAPKILRINGLLYVWRAQFVRTHNAWRGRGRHLMLETPESRAVSIDDLKQFRRTDLMIRGGLIPLPWLKEK